MSPKAKTSVNQLKAGFNALKGLIAGHSADEKTAQATDEATRQVETAKSLTAKKGRNSADTENKTKKGKQQLATEERAIDRQPAVTVIKKADVDRQSKTADRTSGLVDDSHSGTANRLGERPAKGHRDGAQQATTEDHASRDAVDRQSTGNEGDQQVKAGARENDEPAADRPSRSSAQKVQAKTERSMASGDEMPGSESGRSATSGDVMPRNESGKIATTGAAASLGKGRTEKPEVMKPTEEEQGQEMFLDQGYFDEAVRDLRAANSPAKRAAAARALGLIGSQRGTAYLIPAMFDSDPEVRGAAEEALAIIGDPAKAQGMAVPKKEGDPAKTTVAETPQIPPPPKTDKATAVKSTTGKTAAAETSVQTELPAATPAAPATTEVDETTTAKSKVHGKASSVEQTRGEALPKGQHARVQGKAKPAAAKSKSAESQTQVEQRTQPALVVVPGTTKEEEQLLLEEHAVRERVELLERQLVEKTKARKESENQTRWRIEREAKLRADAEARRREEEEQRKQALETAEARRREDGELRMQALEAAEARRREDVEQLRRVQEAAEARRREDEEQLRKVQEAAEARRREEAEQLMQAQEAANARRIEEEVQRQKAEEEVAQLRVQDSGAVTTEHRARAKAETQAHRLAEEEMRLRLEAAELTQVAEELARRRADMENARLDAAAAQRHAEAKRAREEADQQHQAELERLRHDEHALRTATDKAALRRAEVDAARERADKDAERLTEAKARMKAAEEARDKAEAERAQVEAELHLQVETAQRRLEEARRHAQEEQMRLEEAARHHKEAEEQRLAELEYSRQMAELEAKQRAEREQQIISQIDSLRIADAEVRKRIEDAEVRRRASEEAYRLAAEKVQRVEAEAHSSALEEEQMLAKLESERRNVANEAQARAEQEKRIKEEIEMFRRLEDEERPRLEELVLQRTAAEVRLQQQRERLLAEEEVRVRAEEQLKVMQQFRPAPAATPVAAERAEDTLADLAPAVSPVYEASMGVPAAAVAGALYQPAALDTVDDVADADVPPAIALYLHSVDPYKRAAAVAELARSQAEDAFDLIARCFDDHSPHVRNAAARALRKLEPTRTVDLFNRALEEGSEDRRRNIGAAIAASGLAAEAIDNLVSESREDTYNALSILFVMAKTGEVQPLIQAIEEHENDEVCRAVIKLLNLSGQTEIGDAALQRRVLGVSASRRIANGHDQAAQ